jgi:hypothetical protein
MGLKNKRYCCIVFMNSAHSTRDLIVNLCEPGARTFKEDQMGIVVLVLAAAMVVAIGMLWSRQNRRRRPVPAYGVIKNAERFGLASQEKDRLR